MREENDLKAVFEGVYANLKDEGVFLFDVHSLHQVNNVFPGYQYIHQDEDDVFLWESFEGDLENSVEHLLTFSSKMKMVRLIVSKNYTRNAYLKSQSTKSY